MEVDNILQLLNVVQQEFHITSVETNTHTIEKAQCLKFKEGHEIVRCQRTMILRVG